jgi:hypothetical protein
MPDLHEDKSKYSVKARDKIKLKRDLGSEALATLASREPSKLC